MIKQENFKGGINWRLAPWHPEMKSRNQCVYMQGFRYKNDFVESMPGTRKYHGTSLGTDPITAILPYYNDQNDNFVLLAATGDKIVKRDPATNEFTTLKSGLTPNSIHGSAIRHGVQYIPSTSDGLSKYLGGNQIESVGGGSTAPGSFRYVIYMKEIDRLFGISDDAVYGQITWSNLSQPEIWDGANVERIKLKDGERVEGADVLFGKLIVFCTYSIWIYYVSGNEENWKLEEAPTSIGCVAPNTIKRIGSEIWFLGESPRNQLGVYAFNGSSNRILTDDIEPMFKTSNKERLRNACAEVHDDLYTLSFATGFSQVNNTTIDLDLINSKEDLSPAIYGPHPFGFRSACVLNNRQNEKEFLMGGEDDGFIYKEGGQTLKSVNGIDGELLPLRFLSRVHFDGTNETMKRYTMLNVMFRPTSYFKAKINYILSTGSYAIENTLNPHVQAQSYGGEFDVYDIPFNGTPNLYEFQEFLDRDAIGTSIQIEIISHDAGKRLKFDGYGYEKIDLYKTRKVQIYAI